MNKYVYRFACSVLLIGLAVSSFAFVWFRFIRVNNQTGHLMGAGNITMALILYSAIFFINGQWLRAFKLGVERKAKVVAGVVITVLVTDFLEIPISMAITGQFRFFTAFLVRYSILALVQSGVLIVLTICMVNIYRMIISPLTILEIVGDYKNDLAKELNGLANKYSIEETVYYSDEDIEKKMERFDAVLINDIPTSAEKKILKICFERNKRVYVVPKLSDIIIKSSEDINLVDTPLFLCRNLGISVWKSAIKRGMDLFFSTFAVIILSPILIVTAIAIKLEDGGPVFYTQERVTYLGRRFRILKFRSMIVDAEKDGRPHPAGEKDDRITRIGRIIRAYRIDELPQLINIIKGDMSIVGPRPERWEHVEKYTEEIPEFVYRFKVKGGLTGYAQVYGKYNTSALNKLKMDLIYITNYRLLLDVQIVFETLKILFLKESTEGFAQNRIDEIHEGTNYSKQNRA